MILFTSKSPRRIALLDQIGYQENKHVKFIDIALNHQFHQDDESISLEQVREETIKAARKKIKYTVEQALRLRAMGLRPESTVVAGADTVVYLPAFDPSSRAVIGEVLDRPMLLDPADASEDQINDGEINARRMLSSLSGRLIYIITGIVLAQGDNLSNERFVSVVTEARMKPFGEDEINRYVLTGEPLEKAGAFGIQERGVALFESIKGSYSNVVGLPLVEFTQLLADPLFQGRSEAPLASRPQAGEPSIRRWVPELAVVSAGDINFDLVYSELAPGFFSGLTPPGVHQRGQLQRRVGGTAVIFALKAQKAGFSNCSVLGVIGGDALGKSIEEELNKEKKIRTLLPTDYEKKTGVALLLRDMAQEDTALTLTDARQSLSLSDVDKVKSEIKKAGLLFVSGYCLVDKDRRDAACKALELAKDAGSLVVLDVIVGMEKADYDSANKFRYDELIGLLTSKSHGRVNVDVLVSEIPTVLSWLGAADRKQTDWEYIKNHALPELRKKFSAVFLRTSNYSHEIIASPAGIVGPISLDYSQLPSDERLGYGDSVTARRLYDYMSPRILLASASPRRLQLLKQIIADNKVEVRVSDYPEEYISDEHPEQRVSRLALAKAEHVLKQGEFSPSVEIIIGADTEIALPDEKGGLEVIKQPATPEEARQALKRLSGKTHQAITGLALIHVRDLDPATARNKKIVECVSTKVVFRTLTDAEIDEYIQSGEPIGKAGAYGIQGKGALLIEGIDGSYSNVVGLPLERLSEIFSKEFGLPIWDLDKVSHWRFPFTTEAADERST